MNRSDLARGETQEHGILFGLVLSFKIFFGLAVTFLRKKKTIHNDSLLFIGPIRSLRAYVLTRLQHSEIGITVATQFMGIKFLTEAQDSISRENLRH